MFDDKSSTDKEKVFIGASNGWIFKIECNIQELEVIFYNELINKFFLFQKYRWNVII